MSRPICLIYPGQPITMLERSAHCKNGLFYEKFGEKASGAPRDGRRWKERRARTSRRAYECNVRRRRRVLAATREAAGSGEYTEPAAPEACRRRSRQKPRFLAA